jgi:uncharacterized protein DUF4386
MAERITEMSPRSKARLAGVFEVLEGLTSATGQVMILGRLIVSGNAAATAALILGHERLFWFGFALSLIGVVFHIAWALLFYDLFKVVNRTLSLLAAFVILVGCAIQGLTCLFYIAPLAVLEGGNSVSAFATEQLQALAAVFLKLNGQAFDLYLVFFGLWCVLIGYLIFRSNFMPRILGALVVISGLGWSTFVSPPLAHHLFPYIAAASALGEIPLQLWLVVMGVNSQRWQEQAGGTGKRRNGDHSALPKREERT